MPAVVEELSLSLSRYVSLMSLCLCLRLSLSLFLNIYLFARSVFLRGVDDAHTTYCPFRVSRFFLHAPLLCPLAAEPNGDLTRTCPAAMHGGSFMEDAAVIATSYLACSAPDAEADASRVKDQEQEAVARRS